MATSVTLGVVLATAAMLAVLAFVSQGAAPYPPAPLREGPRVMMTAVAPAGAIGPPVSDQIGTGREGGRLPSRTAVEIRADQALADTVNGTPGTAPSSQEPPMSDTVPLPTAADAILSAIRTGQVPATVTNAELGRIAGCHQRTACRHLGTLARRGVIHIERVAPNPGGLGTLPTGRRLSAAPAPTPAAPASSALC